jgi:Na+-driven multidrug efflux pump
MTVGQGVFRGIQNMRVPLAITVVTNLIHLALDPLLIFHLHMGLKGAAISTMASEWLAAGCYCGLVWQQRQVLGLWPPPRLDFAQAKERYLPFCQVRGGAAGGEGGMRVMTAVAGFNALVAP